MSIRVAVLGAGSWTCVNHLPAIENRDDVEFVACVDTLEERRHNVAQRFAFDVVTEDVDEALETGPDAVIVGATPDAHYPLVRAALESDCHVLCEKPFTTSGAEAWELVELARERKRHLLVAFGWNYVPMTIKAKALLDEHGIGIPQHLQIHMATALREMYQAVMPVWGRPPEFLPVPSSYTSLEKGAGYTQAQLSHALGLALYLVPLRGESVFALMSSPGAEVDLYDAVSVRFREGAIGSVSGACCPLGANENKHQLEIRIFGSDGQLLLDYDRELAWLYRDESLDVRLDLEPGAGTYACDGPANTLLDLAAGKPAVNRSPGDLAATTTEIVHAAYASWRSGRLESCEREGQAVGAG
jgi:predicted dehydrogenase